MNSFRIPGEFEPQSSVLLTWPVAEWATPVLNNDLVSAEIVSALISEADIIICCHNDDVETRAKKALKRAGCDIERIQFALYPCEIPYPRDFGAEVLIDNNGSLKNVSFRFDTYGYYSENDDISTRLYKFSQFHAELAGIQNTQSSTLISEGGDHEFNGQGIMMSILDTETMKRNPDKTIGQVEDEFNQVFGIEKMIWLPHCSYTDEHSCYGTIPDENGEFSAYRCASANGHIDEICRFASRDTILIASVTEEEASQNILHRLEKERLDEVYAVISQAVDLEGKPFRILKMPVPEPVYIDLSEDDHVFSMTWDNDGWEVDALEDGTPYPHPPIHVLPAMSYCNFLICNHVVLAAKYYKEGMPDAVRQKDELALKVLQTAFPEHKIIQINPLALNLYGGGIHCHTRNIPAKQQHPLRRKGENH